MTETLEPGDKVKLTQETTFYWHGEEESEEEITLPQGTILEVFSSGQTGIDEPYYSLECDHPDRGDIDIAITVSKAAEVLVRWEGDKE
ncbi:hypothetical protein D3C74_241610 [compost metagenome]